jgi:hypothetical protein
LGGVAFADGAFVGAVFGGVGLAEAAVLGGRLLLAGADFLAGAAFFDAAAAFFGGGVGLAAFLALPWGRVFSAALLRSFISFLRRGRAAHRQKWNPHYLWAREKRFALCSIAKEFRPRPLASTKHYPKTASHDHPAMFLSL